jgi:hypothetical protein
MHRTSPHTILLLLLMVCVPAWAYDDNFDDNAIGPTWTAIIDAPGVLTINEQNQRLEATATGGGLMTNDAIYLSNGPAGFRLATSTDFEIAIDYSFAAHGGFVGALNDAVALAFGVGRDLDGTDSAAIAFGYTHTLFLGNPITTSALGVAYRVNDAQSPVPLNIGPFSGTFVIAYDAIADELTLGVEGGSSHTLTGMVQGTWNATELFVSFGARGRGFVVNEGQAYLDNFVIRSGSVMPIPEPGTLTLLTGVLLASCGTRRRAACRTTAGRG